MLIDREFLGAWNIKRISRRKIQITLPKGMHVTGEDLPIEDLLSAIATHSSIKAGRKLRTNAREK